MWKRQNRHVPGKPLHYPGVNTYYYRSADKHVAQVTRGNLWMLASLTRCRSHARVIQILTGRRLAYTAISWGLDSFYWSLLVPGGGVEPPRPQGSADFESAASASSAIPARFLF